MGSRLHQLAEIGVRIVLMEIVPTVAEIAAEGADRAEAAEEAVAVGRAAAADAADAVVRGTEKERPRISEIRKAAMRIAAFCWRALARETMRAIIPG